MYGIQIKIIGEIAFESRIKLSAGYLCDIPVDQLGIPYLPLAEILRDSELYAAVPDVRIGFARPDGYLGLIREADQLVRRIPNGAEQIRAHYTNDRFLRDRGIRVRSLKSGQTFYAPIHLREKDLTAVREQIRNIKRIGISRNEITGAVECSLCEMEKEYGKERKLSKLLTYSSLQYSLVLLTPTCMYAPFEDEDKTLKYVPGAELRKALSSYLGDDSLARELREMRFSNAYISEHGKRLLPVPLCMSVVKLDKEQLRYRLAPGKDPGRVEQDHQLKGAFSSGFEEHFMQYTVPEAERVTSRSGMLCDALSQGQTFTGTICGTDDRIRRLAEWIRRNPRISIGDLTEEGFGEVYISVSGLCEDAIGAEHLSSSFDVCCLSHTLLLDEEGMQSCRAEDLLSELEYRTGLEGKLEIAGKYTEVYTDYSDRCGWGKDGPVTRCLKMGSVLRIRTKDGRGADISPILHTFIGEDTSDGYGEIMAYPARDGYYRITHENIPRKYEMDIPAAARDLHIGARMVHDVLTAILKSRVRGLALADSGEYAGSGEIGDYIPAELLSVFGDMYDPNLDGEVMEAWYREYLEEGNQYAGNKS